MAATKTLPRSGNNISLERNGLTFIGEC